MIHYHGTPITPNTAAAKVLQSRHAFVSYLHPQQLNIAIDLCQSLAVDNGAFTAWRRGEPITDWSGYYDWAGSLKRVPNIDFAVIPDVIDGDERANDELLEEWPHGKFFGVPVWHMHESIERLERLSEEYNRVCLGSSGEFSKVGTKAWWGKMSEAMDAVCNEEGLPPCKFHGLRMLNPAVFSKLPLTSADSTSVGRNIGIDSGWKGTYQPPDKDWRAVTLASRFESHNAPYKWEKESI